MRDTSPLASLWREMRPAAVVSIAAVSAQDETEMRDAGVIVVSTLLSPISGRTATSVPQTLIGRLQVEHLAVKGHRRLGYAAPDDPRVGDFFHLRLDGARIACLDLGLDLPEVLTVPLDVTAAAEAVTQWRAHDEPVTAVCAYNDEVAFAVLAGMHQLGLTAPHDLAVVGVDNIPLATLASPPLTTIDQRLDLLTVHMAGQIVSALRGGPAPAPLRSDSVKLVERESA
ncbi:MAG: substrate-binding domain-containing protein [Cellulomonadaceae bacterium]|nr:substrate-binding domain-containing protein [Cellulomonadaceae bacterium]